MRVLLLCVALGACAARPAVPICPVPVRYTPAQEHALAAELPSDGPVTQRAIADYLGLRDAVRVCARVP
nr:hypothetical protein [uncultured Lichenicoccus sp.]